MVDMWRQRQAKILRLFRKIHRALGISLFLLFTLIALSGLLLGWKKNSGGYLLAKSYQGTSDKQETWLPVDSLTKIALQVLADSISTDLPPRLDRIDFRPDKGMVKYVFTDHYWGIQLDCVTGQVLTIEKRRSDFIEHLHDFSYFDKLTGTKNSKLKLFYTTIMGLALLGFTTTGFWLWYGPKLMRQHKN